MKMAGASSMCQIMRDFNGRSHSPTVGYGSEACSSSREFILSSFVLMPPNRFHYRSVAFSSLQSMPSGDIPVISDHVSPAINDYEFPSEGFSSVAGGIVALGKFDALHVGHRELAIQASKVGIPYLLSFVGIGEVLGWEPRPPVVAPCDRARVLSSWASHCGNVAPREFQIEFSSVRRLTPEQFVKKLSKMGVHGVVAGENYRFGYKAAGDAADLLRLCSQHNLKGYIINSVMDTNRNSENLKSDDATEKGQVSSTRVRQALAAGNMRYVSQLLDRPHRLLLSVAGLERPVVCVGNFLTVRVPKSCFLNLSPRDGAYENCLLVVAEDILGKCSVFIDDSGIYLECKEVNLCNYRIPEFRVLGIEFID